MAREILGVVGKLRSGKTTASQYIQEKYGATIYRNSAILERILIALSLEPTRKNLVAVGEALFREFWFTILTDANLNKMRHELEDRDGEIQLIVIDGIRFESEVRLYRKLPFFRLMYLEADECVRYQRALQTVGKIGKQRHALSKEEFVEQHRAVAESEMDRLAALCDIKVENNDTLPKFYQSLDGVMSMGLTIEDSADIKKTYKAK